MTEETFKQKVNKLNEVEAQIKALQESMIDTDMEVVKYLSDKFETREEFDKWLEENKLPGFVCLLMFHHYKHKK